jgi:hypothetical protein
MNLDVLEDGLPVSAPVSAEANTTFNYSFFKWIDGLGADTGRPSGFGM